MDIRYLESLIQTVELGSIARAARAQNLTPAAVGQRIATLEKYFNVPLLNRNAHKASPTENCLNLLPSARQIVSEFQAMNAHIEPSGLAGRFVLGAVSTAFPQLTGRLIDEQPHVADPQPVLEQHGIHV